MDITIRFRGPIARQLENPIFSINVEKESTIRQVMQMLLEKESEVNEIWSDVDTIDHEAMILVNDVDIGLTGGLDTTLRQGDELVVLPLVHGG